MIEALALTAGILLGLVISKFVFQRKTFVVEDYKIECVDKGGFAKLVVTMKDQNDATLPLEFHPNHAHAFSDDLLRESARSRKKED